MVVSLALVGFGASGSILTARGKNPTPDEAHRDLAKYGTLFGITLILAFFAATSIRVESLEIWNHLGDFLGLLLMFALLAVPLLLAGLAIGTAITCFSDRVGKVYAADLIGSAVGAGIAPWVLAECRRDDGRDPRRGLRTRVRLPVRVAGRWSPQVDPRGDCRTRCTRRRRIHDGGPALEDPVRAAQGFPGHGARTHDPQSGGAHRYRARPSRGHVHRRPVRRQGTPRRRPARHPSGWHGAERDVRGRGRLREVRRPRRHAGGVGLPVSQDLWQVESAGSGHRCPAAGRTSWWRSTIRRPRSRRSRSIRP